MVKRTTKHLPSLFEKTASDTWKRLKASLELGVSQNETTITDIILLDLKAAKCPSLHVMKTPQHLESSQGTDWEWWIGAHSVGWLRYAVQAKKVDFSSLRYDDLAHKVNGRLQLDILRSYSSANEALGRYCFYNYTNSVQQTEHWHCNLPFDSSQLGCSLATLSTVSKAINTWGCRNFEFVHSENSTLPFRCLLTCPMILSAYAGATRFPLDLRIMRMHRYMNLFHAIFKKVLRQVLLKDGIQSSTVMRFGIVLNAYLWQNYLTGQTEPKLNAVYSSHLTLHGSGRTKATGRVAKATCHRCVLPLALNLSVREVV